MCGLEVSGLGSGQVARSFEDNTVFSNFIKWRNYLENLWKYPASEEVCSFPRSCFVGYSVSDLVSYEI